MPMQFQLRIKFTWHNFFYCCLLLSINAVVVVNVTQIESTSLFFPHCVRWNWNKFTGTFRLSHRIKFNVVIMAIIKTQSTLPILSPIERHFHRWLIFPPFISLRIIFIELRLTSEFNSNANLFVPLVSAIQPKWPKIKIPLGLTIFNIFDVQCRFLNGSFSLRITFFLSPFHHELIWYTQYLPFHATINCGYFATIRVHSHAIKRFGWKNQHTFHVKTNWMELGKDLLILPELNQIKLQ